MLIQTHIKKLKTTKENMSIVLGIIIIIIGGVGGGKF
jgi:hypothetical protein